MQTDAVEQQEQIGALRDFAATGLAELERLLAEDDRGQATALENFATGLDLAELERLLAGEKQAQIAALERFATASDLETLRELAEEQRTEFDPFQMLNLWRREDIHSRVLTWLLGPNNNHGLSDYFLKQFLSRVGLSSEDIESFDWTPAESQREWYCVVAGGSGWLDILVLNNSAKFLCAIENKVFAPESVGQLSHYRKALESSYPNFTKHYVFLSPDGRLSQEETEREIWTPEKYTTILQLLEEMLEAKAATMSEDVRVFLRQYATTLRRKIVPESSEVSKLARKIYLEHREAIDLIKDHEPAWQAETVQMLKEAVARQSNWILDVTDDDYVRFRSANWDHFEAMQTGTGWAPDSNALLLFQFRFDDDELPYLDLGLSTGDETNNRLRTKLFETIRQNPGVFALKTTSLNDRNDRWPILHEEPECFLEDADYGVGWDDGTTRAKIEAWVSNFAEHQFPAMNEVIVKCLEEYEA